MLRMELIVFCFVLAILIACISLPVQASFSSPSFRFNALDGVNIDDGAAGLQTIYLLSSIKLCANPAAPTPRILRAPVQDGEWLNFDWDREEESPQRDEDIPLGYSSGEDLELPLGFSSTEEMLMGIKHSVDGLFWCAILTMSSMVVYIICRAVYPLFRG